VIGRWFGRRSRDDGFGPVCPVCGRYDWPEQPTVGVPCDCGGHSSRSCPCGFTVEIPEPGPECG
jgi:hypothetical protein